MKKIRKAIILVGGYGTRFLPATKAQPKEMLTLVDKPVVQYLVEEAVRSGIREIIFVTSRNKRAIEDHFDHAPELEAELRKRGKARQADEVHRLATLAKFTYVRQKEQRGPGDALLEVRHLIGQYEPVAVLYGDDVVDSKTPCLKQMIRVFEKYQKPVLALESVSSQEVSRYGIVAGKRIAPRLYRIFRIIEKPKPESAPSNLAAIGKYIYTPDLIALLPRMKPSHGGELFPTDILDLYMRRGGVIYGYAYQGIRYDCGEKLGYLKAMVQLGMKHPEVGKAFRKYLEEIDI